ncbi:MAG: hypothetical protein QNJ13_01635 [Paracoccaceae bacterium]|nr:hypothetical protein [Paracoccaceae bacterium]
MKRLAIMLSLAMLTGCETVGFGTAISVGTDGTSVTNTVSGTSGRTTAGVSVGL